jgi:hypothetical protein
VSVSPPFNKVGFSVFEPLSAFRRADWPGWMVGGGRSQRAAQDGSARRFHLRARIHLTRQPEPRLKPGGSRFRSESSPEWTIDCPPKRMPTPASPQTNHFRCEACGRKFNSSEELKAHQAECAAAKATGSGSTKTGQGGREEGEDREWVSTP